MEKNIVEDVKKNPAEFSAEDEIDLLELLRVIWKNRIMISQK